MDPAVNEQMREDGRGFTGKYTGILVPSQPLGPEAQELFLSQMSHELRGPLNAVLGFTGTLLMGLAGPLSEEQARQLGIVQDSGRQLLSRIDALLDASRMRS